MNKPAKLALALALRIVSSNQGSQCHPFQKRHDLKTTQSGLFTDIKQGANVFVMQSLNSPIGSFEFCRGVGIESQLIWQKLQYDKAVVVLILPIWIDRLPYLPHAAGAAQRQAGEC